jgi:hypothetical protein
VALVTTSDLKKYMDITFSNTQEEAAQMVLDRTGSAVQDVTKPPFVLYTRRSPVVSVASLTVQGQSDSSATAQTVGTDYVVRRYGVDMFTVQDNDIIVINYTAGLDAAADNTTALKLIVLRAASREVQNLHDDVVGMKDLTTRNVAPMVTGFTPEEMNSVKRWRRVRVA